MIRAARILAVVSFGTVAVALVALTVGYVAISSAVADDWRQRGIETHYEAMPGANHFTVVDPLADPGSAMTARCAALAARCAKVDK